MRRLLPSTDGLAHYFLLAIICAGMAIGGAYYLVRSYADTCSARTASCSKPSTTTSFTWAGYQATLPGTSTKHFNAAAGEFAVPTIACDSKDAQEAYESFSQWVGIDGVNNEDLVQTGIEAHCVANANHKFQAVYFPWWEVIQGAGNDVWRGRQFTVRPGDIMSARVNFANGKYTIALQNKTTGKGFTQVKTCANNKSPCPRSSAEWVIERPGGANMNGYGGVLANFGKASFSKVNAQLSNTSASLNLKQVSAQTVNMADSKATLATTSAPSKNYDSFTMTFLKHGTTTGTTPH